MKVTLKGNEIEVVGVQPTVGELAPDFELENVEGEVIGLEDFKGDLVLMSVFPDINTRICDLQTKRFFEDASKYDGVTIVNISNNTIDQLTDWCATENVEAAMLSDKDLSFARAYGLYVPELDALARAIFLVDGEGKLVYSEIVPEVAQEPDYDAVFAAVESLA